MGLINFVVWWVKGVSMTCIGVGSIEIGVGCEREFCGIWIALCLEKCLDVVGFGFYEFGYYEFGGCVFVGLASLCWVVLDSLVAGFWRW